MKKRIFITSVIIILLHSLAFACGNNWLVKSKKGGTALCPDGKVKVDICHKNKKVINVAWEGWINGHKKHGDTLGDCNSDTPTTDTATAMTPEADWTITNYESYGSRPVVIQRAVDPDYGTRWTKLSDGSTTVFYNYEGSIKIEKTINDTHGIQNEFVYYENGNMKYDVSHVSWEDYAVEQDYYLDTYTESGLQDTHIAKNRDGEIVVNRFTETGYVRGTESTQAEKDLYNQYFN